METMEKEVAENTERALWARLLSRGSVEVLEIPEGEAPPAGFLPFLPSDPPVTEGLDAPMPHYGMEGGAVVQEWDVVRDDPAMVRSEIERLKRELSAGDYRVTKAFEASLTGGELPYDVHALHLERQAMRDRINELEAMAAEGRP